jgi:hypothetical protein
MGISRYALARCDGAQEPSGFERRRSDGTIDVTREQITAVLGFVAQSLKG